MAYHVPITTEGWARIRYDYESTDRKVFDISAEHGISESTLRDRVRRWGWQRRRSGPLPRQGPPPLAVPMVAVAALEGPALAPTDARAVPGEAGPESGDERDEVDDRREGRFVDDARPIGERLRSAIAQVMPALEVTLSSVAAGPMPPRQLEQVARALGSLTRTLRELNGLVDQYEAQGADDEPVEDLEALRADQKRAIQAIAAEEEDAGQRYLAGWEEFAREAADLALL